MTGSGLVHTLFSFNGRVGRGVFWGWAVFLFVAQFAGSYLAISSTAHLGQQAMTGASKGAPILVGLLFLWPSLAVSVKRWHDVDKSGWWVLINLIPLLGWLVSLAYNGFVPGTPQQNQFGEAAK